MNDNKNYQAMELTQRLYGTLVEYTCSSPDGVSAKVFLSALAALPALVIRNVFRNNDKVASYVAEEFAKLIPDIVLKAPQRLESLEAFMEEITLLTQRYNE